MWLERYSAGESDVDELLLRMVLLFIERGTIRG